MYREYVRKSAEIELTEAMLQESAAETAQKRDMKARTPFSANLQGRRQPSKDSTGAMVEVEAT